MTRRLFAAGRGRAADLDDAGDAGLSLVELLVAMFVTSILLAGVATVFTGTLTGVRKVNVKTATSADARISMEAMSRTIRVAVEPSGQPSAIAVATDHTLSFYALLNRTGTAGAQPLATLVEYAWSANCVTEAQTPGRLNSSGVLVWDTGRTVKCLARTSVAPDFAFFVDGVTAVPLIVPASGLTAMARQTVYSIQATVTVKDPSNADVSGVPVRDRVTLVNVLNGA